MRELVPPTHHHTASHTEQREKDICPARPELCAASIDRAARCGRHAFGFLFVCCSCLAYCTFRALSRYSVLSRRVRVFVSEQS